MKCSFRVYKSKENFATLRRTGEIFQAVILKTADQAHQSFDYHIVPVGGIVPVRESRNPIFSWKDLAAGLRTERADVVLEVNQLRSDDIIDDEKWSANVKKLIKRVVGGKTGKFLIGDKKDRFNSSIWDLKRMTAWRLGRPRIFRIPKFLMKFLLMIAHCYAFMKTVRLKMMRKIYVIWHMMTNKRNKLSETHILKKHRKDPN